MSDPHEFHEDGNDYSMCICGIPAATHDRVMAQGLREQAASETDAPARPLAPDAPDGLTSGPESLMDVLANMPRIQLVVNKRVAALRATIVELSDALAETRATIAGLRDTIAVLTRVIQGHDRERQGFKAAIAQRDATIARMRTGRP